VQHDKPESYRTFECGADLIPGPQSNRQVAELIAQFRTHPGGNWRPLADDIELALDTRIEWALNDPPAYRALEAVHAKR